MNTRLIATVSCAIILITIWWAFEEATGRLIINLLGCAYLMYASLMKIENQPQDDDTFLLASWMTFTVFKVVEEVADVMINSIPHYVLIKAVFLFWCLSPMTQGSKSIYALIIKPYLEKKLGIAATGKAADKKEK